MHIYNAIYALYVSGAYIIVMFFVMIGYAIKNTMNDAKEAREYRRKNKKK